MSILIRSRNDFITVRCSGVVCRYLNKIFAKKIIIIIPVEISQSEIYNKERERETHDTYIWKKKKKNWFKIRE